ncbi:NADH-quinone oxidoreductase subunit H [Pseudonocardia sp. KRD-184]|uniref:NADH-quinone oxidoreductase subunit H n=1 Tax=Pseudonocardia oceani TaxID=2792013 RepID=A0ABS6UHH9_9PSEU|nr:NADH-quinone oxidoreductase subunit H [Pseudonocardia oceani]MBW0090318.1 NADH-quinone oxidoreductase subunit H [Pseudonocardia oceani]MBW0097496.1 NADH-quinone oxidoreductase subunit H [Pseudonocardia oceani]MBW0112171.1 NADH-quinone oxidoreductase subunit H [Pseudonocardia oceani]MBW0123499.1 NADH-quinone oxidoreductase subunit H [Pseudonocardia oceani]MBW0131279.1 NADH-quinone oxidoreductase subunit H [Pseudonocardia oceani]
MPDPVVAVGPLWAPAGAILLGALALAAAGLDGAFAARRPGPGAAAGLLVPLTETARLLRQRRRVTVAADLPLWRIGAGGLLVAALLVAAVVPLGRWVLADLSVGVVWFTAVDVAVWAFVWLAGWGPNAVHPLVGGYRFLAQALAYELPLMFALTAPALAAGSLRVGEVAAAQHGLWFVVGMPVAFAVYCVGVVGFSVWGPLSPAVGADIAGGVLAEASGIDRWLLLAGRYALLAAGAVFAVPLFLGGGAGPLLPGAVWVPVKALLLLAVLVWLRRHVPVLRPDRFVEAGWLVLLPAALLQLLVVAVVVVNR